MAIVENMVSTRSGRPVANQFIVEVKDGLAFQSYNSLVALKTYGKLYVSEKWCRSATTLKYFKEFAGLGGVSKAKIQSMIEQGRIIEITERELEDEVIG